MTLRTLRLHFQVASAAIFVSALALYYLPPAAPDGPGWPTRD